MVAQVSIALGVILLHEASGARGQVLQDKHGDAGVQCSDCHRNTSPEPPSHVVCVACHGTTLEREQPVRQRGPDPHRSPHLGPGEVPVCSDCHHVHRESEVTCVMCHRGFKFDIE